MDRGMGRKKSLTILETTASLELGCEMLARSVTAVPKWHSSKGIFVNRNVHKGSILANGVKKPKGRGKMFLISMYSSILVIFGGVSVVVTQSPRCSGC